MTAKARGLSLSAQTCTGRERERERERDRERERETERERQRERQRDREVAKRSNRDATGWGLDMRVQPRIERKRPGEEERGGGGCEMEFVR